MRPQPTLRAGVARDRAESHVGRVSMTHALRFLDCLSIRAQLYHGSNQSQGAENQKRRSMRHVVWHFKQSSGQSGDTKTLFNQLSHSIFPLPLSPSLPPTDFLAKLIRKSWVRDPHDPAPLVALVRSLRMPIPSSRFHSSR